MSLLLVLALHPYIQVLSLRTQVTNGESATGLIYRVPSDLQAHMAKRLTIWYRRHLLASHVHARAAAIADYCAQSIHHNGTIDIPDVAYHNCTSYVDECMRPIAHDQHNTCTAPYVLVCAALAACSAASITITREMGDVRCKCAQILQSGLRAHRWIIGGRQSHGNSRGWLNYTLGIPSR